MTLLAILLMRPRCDFCYFKYLCCAYWCWCCESATSFLSIGGRLIDINANHSFRATLYNSSLARNHCTLISFLCVFLWLLSKDVLVGLIFLMREKEAIKIKQSKSLNVNIHLKSIGNSALSFYIPCNAHLSDLYWFSLNLDTLFSYIHPY